MASCITFFLIQVANGFSRIGHIGLEVDGSLIDVLAEIGLVRKLETLSGCVAWKNAVHSG